MEKSIKISVIIPTYKPDYYIWECLDSIKDQSLDKFFFEVLIILNGDKEPYFAEIKNYIKRNKLFNFKLIYTEEKGVSNARNIGIEISQGDYIAFIDDDDYINKNYLYALFRNINKEKITLANYINFDENKKSKFLKKYCGQSKKLFKFRKHFSIVWGKLIPRWIIRDIRFNTKYKNGEDSLFMVAISKNIRFIEAINNEAIYYRRMRKNSANFKKKEKIYIIKNSYEQIKEYISFYHNNQYDKIFVLIRIMAVIKGMFISIFMRKI